jgi:rhodanese-related sulfurtransferase
MEKKTQIFLVIAVIFFAATAYYFIQKGPKQGTDYGNVDLQTAWDIINEKADLVIIDVRTVSEYESGHIEGAINIPVEELSQRLSELNPSDELLVYCRTGNRSTTAVRILKTDGFEKIYHMDGGITAWRNEGFPVVS